MPNEQLDPKVMALAKSIRQVESGGNYKARGQSGEFGAYQFTPATWAGASRKYLGRDVPLESSTPEEQNEVVYRRVKEWKDRGFDVGQVASMWNAGEGRPNAHLEGHAGVNSYGVSYDTGAYARKVANEYQKLKGGGTAVAHAASAPTSLDSAIQQYKAAESQKASQTPQEGVGGTFLGDVGNTLSEASRKFSTAVAGGPQGDFSIPSRVLQSAGALAGGIGNLGMDALRHVPVLGKAVQGLEGAIGAGVEAAAGTNIGKKVLGGVGEVAQAHPEAAANVGALVDIAGALPVGYGAVKGYQAAARGTRRVLHGAEDAVYDAVSKPLSGKKLAEAARYGTEKTGVFGTIRPKKNPRDLKVSDAVKENVPKFNPGDLSVENVDKIQSVVSRMGQDLKREVAEKGAGRIYSYRDLESKLRGLELPDIIAEEPYLRRLYDKLVTRAVAVAKSKGGKVENLLDVRKEFDAIVARQYPQLYNNMDKTSALKEGVMAIRDALTDFTVKALPDDVALRESLLTQHRLIRAIENLAERAAIGVDKEIGTTNLQRFGQRHPMIKGLVTGGLKAGAVGLGAGGAYGLFGGRD